MQFMPIIDAVELIRMEYAELPELTLTFWQAQRLWNLDAMICDALLRALVDVRFLVEADGIYICSGATRLPGARAVTARSA